MDEWKNRLVHLDHCRGISWKAKYRILRSDPNLYKLYDQPIRYWIETLELSSENTSLFMKDLNNKDFQKMPSIYDKNHIHCLTFLDDQYPSQLSVIYQQPWVLYCKGNLDLLHNSKILAIIGSRTPTEYGKKMVNYLIPDLVKADVCIVSGLARGIDAHAQFSALKSGGNVIAVIGGGLFNIYPKENIPLADLIMKKGLMLSEYPPIMKPEPWHFPMRNRIISGLSRAILVVEGKQRSGTFITIQHGLEQGKDIYAVPGSVFSELSAGPHALIKEGAKLINHANDILYEW